MEGTPLLRPSGMSPTGLSGGRAASSSHFFGSYAALEAVLCPARSGEGDFRVFQ